MRNIAFIFQPHFLTHKFRVSCKEQMGDEFNYVVVTNSESYNGVWKWEARHKDTLEIWTNGKLPCYCVPIEMCTKIKTLEEIKNEQILSVVEETKKLYEDFKKKQKEKK